MKAEWFAARLRELRTAAGLSRKELATKAGLRSEAGIRDIEQGLRSPNWDTVVALCAALGVACDAFLQPPSADAVGATSEPTGEGKAPAGDDPASGADEVSKPVDKPNPPKQGKKRGGGKGPKNRQLAGAAA